MFKDSVLLIVLGGLLSASAFSQQQEPQGTAECIAEANRRNIPKEIRERFIQSCSDPVTQECVNEANRRIMPIGGERSIFISRCREELRAKRAADPGANSASTGSAPSASIQGDSPGGTPSVAAPAWNLSAEPAARTLFGVIELGGKLTLPDCQGGNVPRSSQACRISVGRYGAFPRFALYVDFIYLPSLPEWLTLAPNGLRLANCANAMLRHQQACREEQERLVARTPPRPSMVAVTYGGHIVEVLFFGPASMCDIGARAFEQKWGKPTFVNNQGTNLDWRNKEFGASVLCTTFDVPQPFKHLLGDLLPRNLASYTVRLLAPFESFGRAEQMEHIQERERIGSTGPKL